MYDNAERHADELRMLEEHARKLGYHYTVLALARWRQTVQSQDTLEERFRLSEANATDEQQ